MDNLLVKDAMISNLEYLHKNMPIGEAVELITHNRTSGLPVIDETHRVIGFLSEHDCLQHMLSNTYYCEESVLVGNVMSETVRSVDPDLSLLEAIQRFLDGEAKVFPVINEDDGQLRGILTRTNALQSLSKLNQQCYVPH